MTRKKTASVTAPPPVPVNLKFTRGLCSAARDEVYTALTDYGITVLDITAWGEGHWHQECPDDKIFPDEDPWVKKHICWVTVNATQAEWAERVIWQTNHFNLESRPLVPSLKWKAPADCKAGKHGRVGRGTMFRPWKDNDKPRAKQQRQTRRTRRQTRRTRRQRQRDGGILDTLTKWLR